MKLIISIIGLAFSCLLSAVTPVVAASPKPNSRFLGKRELDVKNVPTT